ncbi:MAG TPA: hypothetical protein V6D08_13615, partial [Candidatus Obscuribacterales bacterium]
MSLVLAFPQAVMAHELTGQEGKIRPEAGAGNIDLSSTERNVPAHHVADFAAATILVGGVAKPVSAADMLTPAEAAALSQVLLSGQQDLQLGALGNAIGGSIASHLVSARAADVVIPKGVTIVHDAAASAFNIAGNLTNAGTLYALSTNQAVTDATLSAANIFNQPGGVITSILPSGGLSGFQSALASLSLTLSAVHDIVNSGTISSSGNLALIAGRSIVNSPANGMSAVSAAIQAAGNVALQAQNIINTGIIASQLGNIQAVTSALNSSGILSALNASVSVANLAGNTLDVRGALGSITAGKAVSFSTAGSIFDQDGSLLKKALLSVSGVEVSAESILFLSPEGKVNIDAGALQGKVEIAAGEANVSVQRGDLQITRFDITGDPVISVQSGSFDYSAGDIVTNGNILSITVPFGGINIAGNIITSPLLSNGAGGEVQLIAEGRVTVGGDIRTSGVNDRGGNVFISSSNLGASGTAISTGNIDTSGTSGGAVIITDTSNTGSIITGTINTSATSGAGRAGGVAIVGPDTIRVGANVGSGTVINNLGIAPQSSGGVFISSNSPLTGAVSGDPAAVNIGSIDNANPIADTTSASVVLLSRGDIQVGSTRHTSNVTAPGPGPGGLGAFPRVTSTLTTTGFPTSGDTASYTITVTPQAQPTITSSNGPTTHNLIAGNFTSLPNLKQSINTSGNLTIDTNGDSSLYVPLAMPSISVGGNVSGTAGPAGSGASVVLVSHETLRLATGGGSSISTAPAAGVSGARGGDVFLLSTTGTGSLGSILGNQTTPAISPVIATALPANSVSSSGGNVLVSAALGTVSIFGPITTSSTGSGRSGNVNLLATFTPNAQQTILSVQKVNAGPSLSPGDIVTANVPIGATGGSGGDVGLYAGSNLLVGNINTSAFGAGNKAGNIILAADNTNNTGATILGTPTAGDLVAGGLDNASGGSIHLDSGDNLFNVGSLVTRSTTGTNVSSWSDDTGTGAAGDLIFTRNALLGMDANQKVVLPLERGVGTVNVLAPVNFAPGSNVLMDGSRSDATARVGLSLVSTTLLGDVVTQNLGSGPAGSIVIAPTNLGLTTGKLITTAAGNSAGNIQILASAGNLSVGNIEALGSGAGHRGGLVVLSAPAGSLQTAGINLSGLAGAAAGNLLLTASSTISIGNSAPDSHGLLGISTAGAAGAGRVNISAGQAIVANSGASADIYASSSGGAGAPVMLTSAGNNGSKSISVGSIDTSGSSGGGFVSLISLDLAASAVEVSDIFTGATAPSATGGSVSIAALGTVTAGKISTAQAGSLKGGSVFVSSGAAMTLDDVTAAAAGTGTSNVVLAASSTIAVGGTTFTAATPGASTGIFPNISGAPSSINVSNSFFVVTVTPGALSNYNPQGYTSIASSTSCCSSAGVRFDTGGDGSLVAPLLSRSTVSLTQGTVTSTASGDSFAIASLGNMSFAASGTSNGSVSAGGTNQAGTIQLLSLTGNISSTSFLTAAGGKGQVIVLAAGPTGQVSITGNNGADSITTAASGANDGGDIFVLAGSQVTIGRRVNSSANASAGDISFAIVHGNLNLNSTGGSPGRFIDATAGSGKGGDLSILIGQSKVDGGGFAGIFSNNDCCSENSANVSSLTGDAGSIAVDILNGPLGCATCPSSGNSRNFLNLIASSTSGNGGKVAVSVGGNIKNRWTINTQGGVNGGDTTVYAAGSITLNNASTSSALGFINTSITTTSSQAIGSGGNIMMRSETGSIDVNFLLSSGGTSGRTSAGSIQLAAPFGRVSISSSNAFNESMTATGTVLGGALSVTAGGDITLADGINISSTRDAGTLAITSTMGNVSFNSPGGASPEKFVNATAIYGDGGDVSIVLGNGFTNQSGFAGIFNSNTCCSENSINASSQFGQGGDITVRIVTGREGCFSCSDSSRNLLNFIVDSSTGNAGSITVDVGGAVNTHWSFSASGANRGNVAIASAGAFTTDKSIIANAL